MKSLSLSTAKAEEPSKLRAVDAATQPSPGTPSSKILLALLAVYTIWGSTYLGIRFALESFPPLLMIGARFIVAGLILLVIVRARGEAMPTRKEWLHSAFAGLLMLGGGTGFTALAEQFIPSSLSATIVTVSPIMAAVIAGIFGMWPRRAEWLGILIGFAGAFLLTFDPSAQANPAGIALQLTGSIFWTLGSILSARKLTLPKGGMTSAAQMLAGGVLVLLIGFARGEAITKEIVPVAVAAWVYLVIFGSIVAYSAYVFLLKHTRPALATSYAYVNPIVAVGLGAVLGGEAISPARVAAMAVILVGVAFLTRARMQGS